MAQKVLLLVEGLSDKAIVERLLRAAGLQTSMLNIVVAMGKPRVTDLAGRLHRQYDQIAALVDLDELSVADAQARAREMLGNPPISVFCAVPTIEAWLFADPEAAIANAMDPEHARDLIRRVRIVDEMPDPTSIARRLYGGGKMSWGRWLDHLDITAASLRSPSLRVFLSGMAKILDRPDPAPADLLGRSLSRTVLSNLISEIVPSDAVLYRTLAGEAVTAEQMRQAITSGNEVGQEWASSLLRLARDILRREAETEA